MRRTMAVVVGILLLAPAAQAGDKLITLIPGLFGPQGLFVDSEARLPTGRRTRRTSTVPSRPSI